MRNMMWFVIVSTISMPALAKSPFPEDTLFALQVPTLELQAGETLNVIGWLDYESACLRFYEGMEFDIEQCVAMLDEEIVEGSGYPTFRIHFYDSGGDTYSDGIDFSSDDAFVMWLTLSADGTTSIPLVTGSVVLPEWLPDGHYVARPQHTAPYDERLLDDPIFADGVAVGITAAPGNEGGGTSGGGIDTSNGDAPTGETVDVGGKENVPQAHSNGAGGPNAQQGGCSATARDAPLWLVGIVCLAYGIGMRRRSRAKR